MRPLQRKATHKHKSARTFKYNAKRTKAPNVATSPQRGGWRL